MGQEMTTSITALNIRIAADASQVYDAAKRMSSTMRNVNQIMDAATTPVERYQQSLARLEAAYMKNRITTEQYIRGVQQIGKAYDESVAKQSKATRQQTESSNAMILSLRRLAGAYLGLQTGKQIIQIAAEAEAASVQFEVLTGSAERASVLIADMKRLAQASPLSLPAVQRGGQLLLSFGMEADKVTQTLRMLADVSGGNQQRFEILSLAFAQTTAAGRLMGQDLLQMINGGFNPLLEISKTTGRSMLDLKKDMEAGAISAKMVEDSFRRATSQGGLFFGMTERMSKTTSGALAQMVGNVTEMSIEIGSRLTPTVIELANSISDLAKNIRDSQSALDGLEFGVNRTYRTFALAGAIIGETFENAELLGQWIAGTKDIEFNISRINEQLDIYYGKTKLVNDLDSQKSVLQEAIEKTEARRAARAKKAAQEAIDAQVTAISLEARKLDQAQKALTVYSSQAQQLMLQRAELTYSAEEYQKIVDRANGLNDAQVESLANIRKDIAERQRIKKEEEDLIRLQEQAADAAIRHFEEQRRKQMEMRSAVAKGPSGFEVGSSEAMRFLAEQSNALIAGIAVPDQPTPGEEELAKQAEKEMKRQMVQDERRRLILIELQKLNVNVVENKVQKLPGRG
jgi:hypothetical protein